MASHVPSSMPLTATPPVLPITPTLFESPVKNTRLNPHDKPTPFTVHERRLEQLQRVISTPHPSRLPLNPIPTLDLSPPQTDDSNQKCQMDLLLAMINLSSHHQKMLYQLVQSQQHYIATLEEQINNFQTFRTELVTSSISPDDKLTTAIQRADLIMKPLLATIPQHLDAQDFEKLFFPYQEQQQHQQQQQQPSLQLHDVSNTEMGLEPTSHISLVDNDPISDNNTHSSIPSVKQQQQQQQQLENGISSKLSPTICQPPEISMLIKTIIYLLQHVLKPITSSYYNYTSRMQFQQRQLHALIDRMEHPMHAVQDILHDLRTKHFPRACDTFKHVQLHSRQLINVLRRHGETTVQTYEAVIHASAPSDSSMQSLFDLAYPKEVSPALDTNALAEAIVQRLVATGSVLNGNAQPQLPQQQSQVLEPPPPQQQQQQQSKPKQQQEQRLQQQQQQSKPQQQQQEQRQQTESQQQPQAEPQHQPQQQQQQLQPAEPQQQHAQQSLEQNLNESENINDKKQPQPRKLDPIEKHLGQSKTPQPNQQTQSQPPKQQSQPNADQLNSQQPQPFEDNCPQQQPQPNHPPLKNKPSEPPAHTTTPQIELSSGVEPLSAKRTRFDVPQAKNSQELVTIAHTDQSINATTPPFDHVSQQRQQQAQHVHQQQPQQQQHVQQPSQSLHQIPQPMQPQSFHQQPPMYQQQHFGQEFRQSTPQQSQQPPPPQQQQQFRNHQQPIDQPTYHHIRPDDNDEYHRNLANANANTIVTTDNPPLGSSSASTLTPSTALSKQPLKPASSSAGSTPRIVLSTVSLQKESPAANHQPAPPTISTPAAAPSKRVVVKTHELTFLPADLLIPGNVSSHQHAVAFIHAVLKLSIFPWYFQLSRSKDHASEARAAISQLENDCDIVKHHWEDLPSMHLLNKLLLFPPFRSHPETLPILQDLQSFFVKLFSSQFTSDDAAFSALHHISGAIVRSSHTRIEKYNWVIQKQWNIVRAYMDRVAHLEKKDPKSDHAYSFHNWTSRAGAFSPEVTQQRILRQIIGFCDSCRAAVRFWFKSDDLSASAPVPVSTQSARPPSLYSSNSHSIALSKSTASYNNPQPIYDDEVFSSTVESPQRQVIYTSKRRLPAETGPPSYHGGSRDGYYPPHLSSSNPQHHHPPPPDMYRQNGGGDSRFFASSHDNYDSAPPHDSYYDSDPRNHNHDDYHHHYQ